MDFRFKCEIKNHITKNKFMTILDLTKAHSEKEKKNFNKVKSFEL